MGQKNNIRKSIWKDFSRGGSHKLVMLFLAEKSVGCESSASMQQIADACGISERQVRNIIRDLEDCGNLWVTSEGHGNAHKSRTYSLSVFGNRGQQNRITNRKSTTCWPTGSQLPPSIYISIHSDNSAKKAPIQGGVVSAENKPTLSLVGAKKVAA